MVEAVPTMSTQTAILAAEDRLAACKHHTCQAPSCRELLVLAMLEAHGSTTIVPAVVVVPGRLDLPVQGQRVAQEARVSHGLMASRARAGEEALGIPRRVRVD